MCFGSGPCRQEPPQLYPIGLWRNRQNVVHPQEHMDRSAPIVLYGVLWDKWQRNRVSHRIVGRPYACVQCVMHPHAIHAYFICAIITFWYRASREGNSINARRRRTYLKCTFAHKRDVSGCSSFALTESVRYFKLKYRISRTWQRGYDAPRRRVEYVVFMGSYGGSAVIHHIWDICDTFRRKWIQSWETKFVCIRTSNCMRKNIYVFYFRFDSR